MTFVVCISTHTHVDPVAFSEPRQHAGLFQENTDSSTSERLAHALPGTVPQPPVWVHLQGPFPSLLLPSNIAEAVQLQCTPVSDGEPRVARAPSLPMCQCALYRIVPSARALVRLFSAYG